MVATQGYQVIQAGLTAIGPVRAVDRIDTELLAILLHGRYLGIGIGGTAEKAMLLAKEAILEPVTMHELLARGPRTRLEELRLEIH